MQPGWTFAQLAPGRMLLKEESSARTVSRPSLIGQILGSYFDKQLLSLHYIYHFQMIPVERKISAWMLGAILTKQTYFESILYYILTSFASA